MFYLSNAFSLSMIPQCEGILEFSEIETETLQTTIAHIEAKGFGTLISCVGHADTAKIFSIILGREVLVHRESISLGGDDLLLVGQYIGPRLPEGTTELPEGAIIRWLLVGHANTEVRPFSDIFA
jgi:hypothetical protein